MLRFSGFELALERAELRAANGATVKLRPKTFEMLRIFAASPGRVLSKRDLMEAVWPNVHVGEDNLFQCIREIRAALGDDKRQLVKLVSGRGYLFHAEVTDTAVPAPQDAVTAAPSVSAGPVPPTETNREPPARRFDFNRWRGAAVAAVAALIFLVGAVTAAVLRPGVILARGPTTIAVMPVTDAGGDPLAVQMAAEVGNRLSDGLAKIENIRVLLPETTAATADYVVKSELQKSEQAWTIRARMTDSGTNEVKWTASYSVSFADDADLPLQQSRLAAGVGHALALRINEMLNARTGATAATDALAGKAKS